MKGFCPLASGSKGNSIYLSTGHTKILIDAGLSAKALASKLSEINVAVEDIDAILITHEHTDHIQGLKVLAYKMGIPVFANHETAKGIVQKPFMTVQSLKSSPQKRLLNLAISKSIHSASSTIL